MWKKGSERCLRSWLRKVTGAQQLEVPLMGRGCSSALSQDGHCTKSHERSSSSTLSYPRIIPALFLPEAASSRLFPAADVQLCRCCCGGSLCCWDPWGHWLAPGGQHWGLCMSVTWWGLPETYSCAFPSPLGGDGSVPAAGTEAMRRKSSSGHETSLHLLAGFLQGKY